MGKRDRWECDTRPSTQEAEETAKALRLSRVQSASPGRSTSTGISFSSTVSASRSEVPAGMTRDGREPAVWGEERVDSHFYDQSRPVGVTARDGEGGSARRSQPSSSAAPMGGRSVARGLGASRRCIELLSRAMDKMKAPRGRGRHLGQGWNLGRRVG